MSTMTLKDRHVLVLGSGASGLAMARWCCRQGASVVVADSRVDAPGFATLESELPTVERVGGALDEGLLRHGPFDLILRSPGLSPAALAPLAAAARSEGIVLSGELDLFGDALAQLYAERAYRPAVLAVTGTNGKTTVTSLTGQLIERAGLSVAVAGNIGPTLLDTLARKLDSGDLPEVWVLELSSFQLAYARSFEPSAAVLLNVSEDHLDWHSDMEDYAAAKAKIFGANGLMILNRDDSRVWAMKPTASKGRPVRSWSSFGLDTPSAVGDWGLESVNGMTWLCRAVAGEEPVRRRGGRGEAPVHIQRLMPVDALRIRGRHNAGNALAALALATSAGCPLAMLLHGLREYRGEPHRVEPIGLIDGVEFFDDSKGTNVGATVAALIGLGGDRKLVVILGGDGKGQDFSPLVGPVSRFARSVHLIGRDAAVIERTLQPTGVSLNQHPSLEEAVRAARRAAQPGDAVLLSPACASLDMFRNYEHRADVFLNEVRAIALDEGQAQGSVP